MAGNYVKSCLYNIVRGISTSAGKSAVELEKRICMGQVKGNGQIPVVEDEWVEEYKKQFSKKLSFD